jgi:hypothetical protein
MRRRQNLVRAVLVTCVLAGFSTVFAPGAEAAPKRLTCRGYDERRVFVEAQAWWTPAGVPAGRRSEHLHVATCFPWRQTLAGVVRFDVRVRLHAMARGASLGRTRIHAYGESEDAVLATIDWGDFVCRARDCTLWRTAYADTRRLGTDGRQEFRFLTRVVRPDGAEIVVTTRWQAYLRNGNPVEHYRSSDNYMGGAGWYTDRGYQTALLSSGIPRAPVSGIWRPQVTLAHGSDALPSTRHLASVDPDFHMGRNGRMVRRAGGEYEGGLAINTRRLGNGVHRLFLRVDETGQRGSRGTVSGAFGVPFVVRN